MSDFDNRLPLWISQNDVLPDTCCCCGMFTDQRVSVKHTFFVTEKAGDSLGLILLGLFFGPLGWLMTLLNSSNDTEKTKTVKKTAKLKLPICRLCESGSPPEVNQYHPGWLKFEVQVHREFVLRFESLPQPLE